LSPEGRTPPAKRTAPQKLKYCLQNSTHQIGTNFVNRECQYWDESFVLFPIVEDHDVFMATRVTMSSENLACNLTSPDCAYQQVGPAQTLYIADIEKFTILLDHTMYTPFLSRNAEQIRGWFLDSKGNKIIDMDPPNQIGQPGKSDIFEVGFLLKAAGGIDLDTVSNTNPNITKRYDGIVILIFVTYSNMENFNQKEVVYFYTAHMIEQTKYKAEQPIYTKTLDNRVIWDRHGIRVIILQTGTIGKFDFQTLLLTFVSGLGLLAVATLIVDTLALRVLPRKQLYSRYKFEKTEEFSQLINEENQEKRPLYEKS